MSKFGSPCVDIQARWQSYSKTQPTLVTIGMGSRYNTAYKYFRSQMPCSNDKQITIEKSGNYFVEDQVPKRIHAMNPNIKLLLMVRNPVTRYMIFTLLL